MQEKALIAMLTQFGPADIISLSNITARVGVSVSTAHHYLHGWLALGLVEPCGNVPTTGPRGKGRPSRAYRLSSMPANASEPASVVLDLSLDNIMHTIIGERAAVPGG